MVLTINVMHERGSGNKLHYQSQLNIILMIIIFAMHQQNNHQIRGMPAKTNVGFF